nr:ras-related protein Rab-28-like isoform X1 [Halyomorpha halys]
MLPRRQKANITFSHGRKQQRTAAQSCLVRRTIFGQIYRFCHNEYSRQYYPTFGTDFLLHRHQLRAGKEVTLVIWDLSGQVLTSPMLSYCLYGANVILVVYDITNAASFSKLQDWIAAVRSTQTDSQPNLAIIANKCDMEHQRAISVEKQVKFANDHGLPTHTVSARTGENVAMALQKVCAEVMGLKLTRLEQEASQVVVKAEILAPTQGQTPTYQSTSSSSVCSIQ